MKTPHSNLFQGEYLFPEGSNYLPVNKYWGCEYFPVNKYWGVLFFGEYLLTVTPGNDLGPHNLKSDLLTIIPLRYVQID